VDLGKKKVEGSVYFLSVFLLVRATTARDSMIRVASMAAVGYSGRYVVPVITIVWLLWV
jgi:hypothetical protein